MSLDLKRLDKTLVIKVFINLYILYYFEPSDVASFISIFTLKKVNKSVQIFIILSNNQKPRLYLFSKCYEHLSYRIDHFNINS